MVVVWMRGRGCSMRDDLTTAQHYRALEKQMRETAEREQDQKSRKELLELAEQYARLADRLIERYGGKGNG